MVNLIFYLAVEACFRKYFVYVLRVAEAIILIANVIANEAKYSSGDGLLFMAFSSLVVR